MKEPNDETPDRDPNGRWLPGQSANAETKWGPKNPPPKSPGRPKRDAWVGALESRLEDPRIAQALADQLLKVALKGGEKASLSAIGMIQDRVGGPVKQQIQAEFTSEARKIFVVGSPSEVPSLPKGVLAIERLRHEAEKQAEIHRRTHEPQDPERRL